MIVSILVMGLRALVAITAAFTPFLCSDVRLFSAKQRLVAAPRPQKSPAWSTSVPDFRLALYSQQQRLLLNNHCCHTHA